MSDKFKMPFEITEEEAKAEHIPSVIIKPMTEEEERDLHMRADKHHERAQSLLTPSPKRLEVEFARRGEFVARNELEFLSDYWDKLDVEEREQRFRAVFVNLSEALIRQGKLQEAKDVAWEGLRHGANTHAYLQKATDLLAAINATDNVWCDCGDTVVEDESNGQIFGGKPGKKLVNSITVPSLQVVDEIPSYKHEGKTVVVVRCNTCGLLNAVPLSALPNRALHIDGKNRNPVAENRKNVSTIQK
jgi:hypothetical protein